MISIKSNVRAVRKSVERVPKQLPFVISKALNDTAYAAQKDVVSEMRARFNGMTPYSGRAIGVVKATKEIYTARIGLREDAPSKGTTWHDTLAHLFTGGQRVKKKSEHALVRKGQFQGGRSFLGIGAGADVDSYGNLSKSKIVQLMAYFNAFKEQGYKANMTDKKRAKMAKGKRIVGPLQPSPYKSINGVVYFMSRGRGWFVGQGKGWQHGRNQPLGAGIYSKTSIHGVVVRPIFVAIRTPNYRKLINMYDVVNNTVKRDFKRNFNAALEFAMRTAR